MMDIGQIDPVANNINHVKMHLDIGFTTHRVGKQIGDTRCWDRDMIARGPHLT